MLSRKVQRWTLAGGGMIAAVGWMALPAGAQSDEGPATMTAEAWYATGSPAVQPSPAGTLHVGVTAGAETARTYLKIDLAGAPEGDGALATLELPIAGVADGTNNLDAARLTACVVTEPFEDGAEGSAAPPPAIDCTIKALANRAGTSKLVVNLLPLIDHWRAGAPNHGLAIIPSPQTSATATATSWHVAFSGRRRTGSDVAPITATFVAGSSESADGVDGGSDLLAPPSDTEEGSKLLVSDDVGSDDGAATETGFRYPVMFAFPLLLAAAGWFFARALTRPVGRQP